MPSIMSRHGNSSKLLKKFDTYQNFVDTKKQEVTAFLEELKKRINNYYLLNGTYFIGTGSSYENTVVRENADFDIILVMPSPFRMENFKLVEVEKEPGIFKLKFTGQRNPVIDKFLDDENFLRVRKLRDKVFNRLCDVIKKMSSDRKTKYGLKKMVSCLRVYGGTFRVDIVPQIGVNCSQLPGWNGANIPSILRSYVDDNENQAYFNLSHPPWLKRESYKNLLVQTTFNVIEKKCLMSSNIRDPIRLAKDAAKKNKWLRQGIRCFYIKRIAIRLFDQLMAYKDPWDGYLLILCELSSMLQRGYVDGFFIKGQNLLYANNEECKKLASNISAKILELNPVAFATLKLSSLRLSN